MATSSLHSHLLKTPPSNFSKKPISNSTQNVSFSIQPHSNKPLSITCAATQVQHQSPTTSTTESQDQDRVFNFASGPATLPENVLRKAESELYNWRGVGMSVMEMSHRGKDFVSIIEKAESDLRKLLNISEDYHVLFLQGGATTKFAAIPLNICKNDDCVDFVVTGSWGDKRSWSF